MAAENDFLGGYTVGSISASLRADSDKEGKKKKRDRSSVLSSSEVVLPTFIPVKRKKNRQSEDNLPKQNSPVDIVLDNDENRTKRKITKGPKNKSCDDDPERLVRTIFVGNLPLSITRKDLKKFFRKYGEIESTRLRSVAVPDLKTSKKVAAIKKIFNPNRNNLNAYVVFKDKESVGKAISSNGTTIGDLHIRVDRVDSNAKQYDHKRSVFVGNLMFDIKEEALSEFFSACGEVVNVRVVRDAATGIGKGFGYVLFKESSSVSLALKLNNSELCGRKIRIQKSQENPSGTSTSRERKHNNFSGMQAKEKFYHRRKIMKQQKKFGLSTARKTTSKLNKKNNKRTLKQNKKGK